MGSTAAGALYGLIADRLFWISAILLGLGAAVAAFMMRRPLGRLDKANVRTAGWVASH